MSLFTRKVSPFAPAPVGAPASHMLPPRPVPDSPKRDPETAKGRLRRRWLGLDIGSSAIKLVELSRMDESYRVEAYAVEPVPTGSVVAGNISDARAVGEAIRSACRRAEVKPRKVCASIRNAAVVTKTLEMDASLDDRQMEVEVTRRSRTPHPLPHGGRGHRLRTDAPVRPMTLRRSTSCWSPAAWNTSRNFRKLRNSPGWVSTLSMSKATARTTRSCMPPGALHPWRWPTSAPPRPR